MPARPRPSLVLVGPTGSGKSPLGEEIERRGLRGRRCVHFDFGANLRAVADDPRASNWLTVAERKSIGASLETGALFEDRDIPMIIKIVDRFVEARILTPDTLLILNGLPRHRSQAEILAGAFGVEGVIQLETPAAVIRERIRRDTGGDRAARVDDSLNAVERRLFDYHERTMPLVEYYRQLGVPVFVVAVTAAMTAAEMFEVIARGTDEGGGG